MAEQFINATNGNLVQTTITTVGGINATATTFTIASATGVPSSPNFRAILDSGTANSEIILVTGISGTTITSCTRGTEAGSNGGAATSHAQGATFSPVVTAGALAQLKLDTLGYQRVTSSPFTLPTSAAQSGVQYMIKNYSGVQLTVQSPSATDTFDLVTGPLTGIGPLSAITLTDDTGLAGNWVIS